MKVITATLIIFFMFFSSSSALNATELDPMVLHPGWYIKILDWSFYSARNVAIIHHVAIETTSDITYKDVKVRVGYYSTSPSNYGVQIGQETGVLPVILPPHSRKTYLRDGRVLGAGSNLMKAGYIEVLGAETVNN